MITHGDPKISVVKTNCEKCGKEEMFYADSSDRICFDCLMGQIDPDKAKKN